jgi:hypothetical protein
MGKSEDNRILCPHCGKDITKAAHKALASLAGKASLKNRDTKYYQDRARLRWEKQRAANEKKKPRS